jgi:uncharacterized membrane protein
MIFDVLSRAERGVLVNPARGILLQRIDAVLIGLCGAFIVALLIGIAWSGNLGANLNAIGVVMIVVVLACAGVMLASQNGIWRGDANAMLVAWIAFAITLVLKGVSLTLSLGMLGQIDAAVLVLVVSGLITMRTLLARGFAIAHIMKEPAPPDAAQSSAN